MIEQWIPLLQLLPTWAAPTVVTLLQVMPFVALALPLVKRAMGHPDPERDSWLKTAVFYVLIGLDWLALNSTPIQEKIRQVEKEQAKRRTSIPGGGR